MMRALAVGTGLLAAMAVAVPVALPRSAAAANGVSNPGFEAGTAGWQCAPTAAAVTGHARSGSYALAGTTTSSDTAQCTQTVPVAPSTSYTLTAQVNGAYVYLGVTGGASTWTPGTGGAYQTLSVTFTTPAAASSVEIYLHGWYGQGVYYADDVSLPVTGTDGPTTTPPTPTTPTPSPTTPSPSPTTPSPTTPTPSPTTPTPTPTTPTPTPTTPTPTPTTPTPTPTGPGASLPACRHFSDATPPVRTAGPNHDATTQAPRITIDGRLPAPGNVRGTLANGSVVITFDRVPGAVAYRVWRNSQSVLRIDDWGQPVLSVTDSRPCRNASYTVVALRNDDSDASTGQLSPPYRLLDSGTLGPGRLSPGTQLTYLITAYNDAGQTASGYQAGLGICAVDTRYIPWGTRMRIDGYGYCYAADIGTWIQGEIVDVWLPGAEADSWGVQRRTVTIE
ncbi:carbohydrate binding domain-containing protein [Actinoplanes sp. N902-109]|uniref:carbohydrate binding domain-containing protein n=1 Tax=Actinoplanes sp. (strain N902-109) TaxID=649831 RepID=UPI0006888F16|nr:carbohydrate binding domain-containing protein [Actinoplanes sp. N902-109]